MAHRKGHSKTTPARKRPARTGGQNLKAIAKRFEHEENPPTEPSIGQLVYRAAAPLRKKVSTHIKKRAAKSVARSRSRRKK